MSEPKKNAYAKFLTRDGEKPLDKIIDDGGFCSIFRSIACVGDSLSSGEFQSLDANDGEYRYHDMYEYSWGQYLARACGSKVYNFSRGGMTAKEYCESFAEENGFWDEQKRCQCYIIALGVNDLLGQHMELGSVEDIVLEDCEQNKHTFAGYYAKIIQKYKKIQPDAKFFLMTMPKEDEVCDGNGIKPLFNELLYKMADIFENTFVLDLYKYAPTYDEEFKKIFYLYGHMNPMGYILTAKMVVSYIDYIVRSNPGRFSQVGFIGTEFYDKKLDS